MRLAKPGIPPIDSRCDEWDCGAWLNFAYHFQAVVADLPELQCEEIAQVEKSRRWDRDGWDANQAKWKATSRVRETSIARVLPPPASAAHNLSRGCVVGARRSRACAGILCSLPEALYIICHSGDRERDNAQGRGVNDSFIDE
jgi:hypothetical protein